MAQNATPAFTKNAIVPAPVPLLLANTKSDGTGNLTSSVTIYKLLTADATNGAFLDYVRFMLTASVASTSSTATLARLYLSSITTGATTSADTFLFAEIALPVTIGDSPTIAQNPIDWPCQFRIPAGYTILCSIHAAPAANTAWIATAYAGDY